MNDLPTAVRSTAGQHVSLDAAGWVDRLCNRMIVVAGNNDRVAVRIDTADDTDMAATPASHHGDSADLWPADTSSVAGIGAREIAATSMAGTLEHQVHESAAPKTAASCRVGPDVFARLGNQRVARRAAIGRVRVRLCARPGTGR